MLPNHAIFGDYAEAALLDLFDAYGPYLETVTVLESRILLSLVDEAIFLQTGGISEPGAEIVQTDLPGCAGPVHIIDRVLLPARPDGSMVDLGPAAAPGPVPFFVEPPLTAALEPDVSADEFVFEELVPLEAAAITPELPLSQADATAPEPDAVVELPPLAAAAVNVAPGPEVPPTTPPPS